MLEMKEKKILNSENGMATLESIPLLIIFVMLVGYGVGAFGVIHTGILHSIAARAYAFETFRHRVDLTYFRDTPTGGRGEFYTGQTRIHGIQSDTASDGDQYIVATERSILKGLPDLNEENRSPAFHNVLGKDGLNRRLGQGVNPVWIRVQYGICLNAQCGD